MYRKLHKNNDWGHEFLSTEKSGPGVHCQRIKFASGQTVSIKWPDGTEQTVVIVLKSIHGTVHDMGNKYDTASELPFFEVEIHGLKQTIALQFVEVDDGSLQ